MTKVSTNQHINHSDIAIFANEVVNLPKEDADEYRAQAGRLCGRLADHIQANPGFGLVKMFQAGSIAKGTALRTINDMDIAVYVRKEAAPSSERDLVPWITERLREANPNLSPDQFDTSEPHCVTVRFRGTGLDVQMVPVLYEGASHDFGYLVDKYTGERTLTSIPLHLEFIRKRKNKNPGHFAQVARLLKWWAQQRKLEDGNFKCKSFMLELITAHHADRNMVDLSHYPSALEIIFSYVVKSGLKSRIAFIDYYDATRLPKNTGAAIEIFDPVNPDNNIASHYTEEDRGQLVLAAEEAGDAVSEAAVAFTKKQAVECWQVIFGPSFGR